MCSPWNVLRYKCTPIWPRRLYCQIIIIIIIAMAIFMALSSWLKVIARVHPVHLMNVDWAPGGRQPSDQASRLGLRVSRKFAVQSAAKSLCLWTVLWHCWMGIRKSMRPVKIECLDVGVVVCLERGADCLHVVQLMPLPWCHPKTASFASFKSRPVLPYWCRLT